MHFVSFPNSNLDSLLCPEMNELFKTEISIIVLNYLYSSISIVETLLTVKVKNKLPNIQREPGYTHNQEQEKADNTFTFRI